MATSPLPPAYQTPPASASTSTTPLPQQQSGSFVFPPYYSFPPFFTLQPVASTRSAQVAHWSSLIQSYCRHTRTFSLSLIDALPTPLFTNSTLRRSLTLRDAKTILLWMASPEGGNRAEWITSTASKKKSTGSSSGEEDGGGQAWIYWRRPEEWAVAIEEWVERTGQKGTVLTLYEIVEGDASAREEFAGMDMELLQKSLAVSVKRGKAQVFGNDGGEGVKFF